MPIEHSNEIDLIRQTLAGNTAAFDRLVKTHRTTVYVVVLSYTKNPADAEDLTQRIFIQAYERLATLRELDRFLPWIQQIAHNACKDWLRRQSDSTTSFEEMDPADYTETVLSPEEIALKREIEAIVQEAIGTLTETDRKLVESRYMEGASYDQLQAESGLSYAAIANRLKRAKQQLRRRIEQLLGGMAILPGRTFIWGGIETVKFSVKTKLVSVGIVAVLGIGGGVWYHHRYELNPVIVNQQRVSEPEGVTEASTEIEQASSPKSITAEERAQLDVAIASLKSLDETVEEQTGSSEARIGTVEQAQNGNPQNGDEVDAEEAYYAQFDEEMNSDSSPLDMVGIPRFIEDATAMYFKPTDADRQRLSKIEAEWEDAASKELLATEEREGYFPYPLDNKTVYVRPDFLEDYEKLGKEYNTIHERSMREGPSIEFLMTPSKKRTLPDGTKLIYYRRRNGDLVRSVEKLDGTVRKWVIGWTDLTPYEEYDSGMPLPWRDD